MDGLFFFRLSLRVFHCNSYSVSLTQVLDLHPVSNNFRLFSPSRTLFPVYFLRELTGMISYPLPFGAILGNMSFGSLMTWFRSWSWNRFSLFPWDSIFNTLSCVNIFFRDLKSRPVWRSSARSSRCFRFLARNWRTTWSFGTFLLWTGLRESWSPVSVYEKKQKYGYHTNRTSV